MENNIIKCENLNKSYGDKVNIPEIGIPTIKTIIKIAIILILILILIFFVSLTMHQ